MTSCSLGCAPPLLFVAPSCLSTLRCNLEARNWRIKVPPNPKIFFSLKWIFAPVRDALRPFFPFSNKSFFCIGFESCEIQASCVHDRVRRGVGLFLIWRHNLLCMHFYKELMQCKSVCDVNSGIDPLPFWLGREQKMLGFLQLSKPIKWQDLLEKLKNGRNAFRTGAKVHFSEKNILGLGAL